MTDDTTDPAPFSEHVVLELMGHRRLAGKLTEVTIAGAAFLRLDIPAREDGAGGATQFYAPAAVYAITPTTEELVRKAAVLNHVEPITRWELRDRLPAPAPVAVDAREYDDGPDYEPADDGTL